MLPTIVSINRMFQQKVPIEDTKPFDIDAFLTNFQPAWYLFFHMHMLARYYLVTLPGRVFIKCVTKVISTSSDGNDNGLEPQRCYI